MILLPDGNLDPAEERERRPARRTGPGRRSVVNGADGVPVDTVELQADRGLREGDELQHAP